MGQVVQTEDPTQFDKFQDLNDIDLLPGAIVVRLRSTGNSIAQEVIAIPANPNFINVPLYGEQVIVFSAIDGRTEDTKTDLYYYLPWINTHGIINNGIMPYIHDTIPEDKGYGTYAVSSPFKSKEPEQLSFEEKNIVTIQPYQGDNIIQDRFGSILRFTSTHKNLDAYSQEPFWDSETAGDPLVALSCGVDGTDQEDGYFTIENPDKDAAFIYLSKSHKISNLTLAQPKVGKEVKPVSSYDKSQVVIGSNRLIFNARVEEIVLCAKKDVKIATPAWQTDMDEFFTLMLAFLDEVINQNENIQAGHSEIGFVAQENALEVHVSPESGASTSTPTNTGQYVASNVRSTVDNTNESLDIRERLQSIRDDFANMQQ
jgi:hypothetical protein